NKFANAVARGWEVSSLTVFQKGLPQTVIITNVDYNNDASFLDKPDAPTRQFGAWSRSDYMRGTFTAADFPAPPKDPVTGAYLREGNIGRNTFRQPGFAQMDFSAIKNTPVPWFTHERAQFQLRFEFFNSLNRVNLTGWSTTLNAGTFGIA